MYYSPCTTVHVLQYTYYSTRPSGQLLFLLFFVTSPQVCFTGGSQTGGQTPPGGTKLLALVLSTEGGAVEKKKSGNTAVNNIFLETFFQ